MLDSDFVRLVLQLPNGGVAELSVSDSDFSAAET